MHASSVTTTCPIIRTGGKEVQMDILVRCGKAEKNCDDGAHPVFF